MIAPSTRLFGLVMSDHSQAWVARLYNALFGHHGLDAAYLTFFVAPERLSLTLTGFRNTAQTEVVHLAPEHQLPAALWLGHARAIDTLQLRGELRGELHDADAASWLSPEHVAARALADAKRWFDRELTPPPDWLATVHEQSFRPCKLTHDVFGSAP